MLITFIKIILYTVYHLFNILHKQSTSKSGTKSHIQFDFSSKNQQWLPKTF